MINIGGFISVFATSRYMFKGASSFDQCLVNTSFPGDATDTDMFVGTAGSTYNPVSDLSDCPTAVPTSTPHAPLIPQDDAFTFSTIYQKLSNKMKKISQPSHRSHSLYTSTRFF